MAAKGPRNIEISAEKAEEKINLVWCNIFIIHDLGGS